MTKWEKLAKTKGLEPFVKAGLDWAYKYYNRMDHTKAYVVAMCKQIYLLTQRKLISICSSEPSDTHELD